MGIVAVAVVAVTVVLVTVDKKEEVLAVEEGTKTNRLEGRVYYITTRSMIRNYKGLKDFGYLIEEIEEGLEDLGEYRITYNKTVIDYSDGLGDQLTEAENEMKDFWKSKGVSVRVEKLKPYTDKGFEIIFSKD